MARWRRMGAGLLACVAMATLQEASAQTRIPTAEEAFEWAEWAMPALFPPYGTTQSLEPYVYRHYPPTGNYLGFKGLSVYAIGPVVGSATPVFVGELTNFACEMFPSTCGGFNASPRPTLIDHRGPLVVRRDGTVLAYSGNGSPTDGSDLVLSGVWRVGGLKDISSILYANLTTYAVTKDGSVRGYGVGASQNLLGSGQFTSPVTPVLPPGRIVKMAVAPGNAYLTYLLTSDGHVWSAPGGDGVAKSDLTWTRRFARVPGLEKVANLSDGDSRTSYAIKGDGSVWELKATTTYGGPIGPGRTISTRVTASEVRTLFDIVQVSCAGTPPNQHCLAVDRIGQTWGWGYNKSGQLGIGTLVDAANPVRVSVPFATEARAGEGSSSYVLTLGGFVYTFGLGLNSGIPNTTPGPNPTPRLIPTLTAIRAISAGPVVLSVDGRVFRWGYDDNGPKAPEPVPGFGLDVF